jgi:hypothetical protein
MKTRTIIFLAVGFLLLGIASVPYLIHRSVQSRIGPQHVYELPEQPKFLTEELAMERARATLARDGLDPAVWQPVPDDRSKAPDGRTDQFLSRNTITPNHGSIMFTNSTGTRFVSVELDGRRVVCQTSIGK